MTLATYPFSPARLVRGGIYGLLALALMLCAATPAFAQTAQVQVIHNSPDPAASTVDIYLEDTGGTVTKLDDVDFRTATGFLSVPADTYDIVVAGETSTSISDQVVFTETGVLLGGGTDYTVIATGVLDPSQFEANPDAISTAFGLQVNTDARSTVSSTDGDVETRVVHGAPDAPTVDVLVRGVSTFVDDASYTDVTPYQSAPAQDLVLDVTPGNDPTTNVATFHADLSGLADTPILLLASGFLTPGNEPSGAPSFGLIAVTPDGTVLELPALADLQVIHNAAGFGDVDIYVDDGVNPPAKLDDFPFRGAVNITAPAEQSATVSINAASSSGINDQQVFSTSVTLTTGTFNQAIAVGADAADLDLVLEAGRSQFSGDFDLASALIVHGSPDAPPVDVLTRGVLGADGLAYKSAAPSSGYVDLPLDPDPSYIFRIGTDDNATFVASFTGDLSGFAGRTVTVLASGFLSPGPSEPGFALIAVSGEIGSTNPTDNVVTLAPAPQDLVINEFFANPETGDDANGDGDTSNENDEFVEIVNTTNASIDVSGYVIEDLVGNTYTFPGGTVIAARESATIFRSGTPTGIPNVVDVGLPALNNGGDVIRLKDDGGTVLDEMNYPGFTPESAGESTTRNPDYFGPMALSGTDLSQSPPYTPGRFNDDSDDLPVDLAGFSARAEGADVVLQWATLSERGNSGFEVQQRVNGAFEKIGFRDGRGTTTERTEYRFRVTDLEPGDYAFRLRQVDVDGGATLSDVVDVTVGLASRYVWTKVGPNPVTTRSRSTLQVREAQQVSVRLYDVLGRQVRTLHDGPMAPGQRYSLDVDGTRLPSGTYFIRATGETFSASQRVSIVR